MLSFSLKQLKQIVAVVVSSRGSNQYIAGFNFKLLQQDLPELHHQCSNTAGTWACSLKNYMRKWLYITVPRQQQSVNFSATATNSLLHSKGQETLSRASPHEHHSLPGDLDARKAITQVITGILKDLSLPFLLLFSPPDHRPHHLWVQWLVLYGVVPTFLLTLKLPSELQCSWNLEWKGWYHR